MNEQNICRCERSFVEQRVTHYQNYKGKLHIIENVPALVCEQCGETYFTPQTHDMILAIVRGELPPTHNLEVPVYDATQYDAKQMEKSA